MTDLSETAIGGSEREGPPDQDLTADAARTEAWRTMLTGNDPYLPKLRKALDGADIRSLEVKGRAEPLDVIAIRESESPAAVA
jgi:hypothetical protein